MGRYRRKGKAADKAGLKLRRSARFSFLELRSRRLRKIVVNSNFVEASSQVRAVRHGDRSHAIFPSTPQSQDSARKFGRRVPSLVPLQSSMSAASSASSFHEEAAISTACSSRIIPALASEDHDRGTLTQNRQSGRKKIMMSSKKLEINTRRNALEAQAVYSGNNSTLMEVKVIPLASDRPVREGASSSYDAHTLEVQGSSDRSACGMFEQGNPASVDFAGRVPEADIEDFFREAEQQQQIRFIQRYNFDPVNDRPLLGRYAWITLQQQQQ